MLQPAHNQFQMQIIIRPITDLNSSAAYSNDEHRSHWR